MLLYGLDALWRRFFVKHRGEGEGSEYIIGVVLEKGYVFAGFLKPAKT